MTTDKVKEVQNYLEKRGIIVAETRFIDASIKIATRWGGNEVFVCEFKKEKGGDKMKKKDEKMADLGLKQLHVTPQIYHFETRVEPFAAITIADNVMSWATVRGAIDDILSTILPLLLHEKATQLREELTEWGIYGVSICDLRDNPNRRRGRTIAKGRLLKHLNKTGVRKVER